MRRLRLIGPNGRIRGEWLALFAWLPLVISEGLRVALGSRVDPLMFDLSVHVRPLVSLPAMLWAERRVESACKSAIHSFYVGEFCDRAEVTRIVDRGHSLRDARWPELALAILALVFGQLALWRIIGPSGVFHGGREEVGWTFTRLWYSAATLPLTLFVMLRWGWRWVIWSHLLFSISRRRLSLLATHPDHAAGLGCLSRPVSGFSGFAFAMGAVLSAAWGTQLLAARTTVQAELPAILVFLLVVVAIAVGPLLPFCGHLYVARRRALAQYGDFADAYVRSFHAKWIAPSKARELSLGSPDIQSLADLGSAFEVIHKTRLFAFGMRSVLAVWFGAVLPALPVFASTLTAEELLQRIISSLLGGIPL